MAADAPAEPHRPAHHAGHHRYWAFISYSSKDRGHAVRLHHALETYRLPAKLIGRVTPAGTIPRRLHPIFRDRDELPVSGDLGETLRAALRESRALVVICSPNSAQSKWVAEEIAAFKRMHGEHRIFALIVDGVPKGTERGAPERECFPAPLRFRMGADGVLSNIRTDPLAADIRSGNDSWRLAYLKLVSGIAGVRLDDLIQRDAQRRQRRLATIASASVASTIFTGGLALYANSQRIEAGRQRVIAEREAQTARATSDFLLRTFRDFEPATENPRRTTVESMLEASLARARAELAGQPVVQAELMGALGQAYNKLGLTRETRREVSAALPTIRQAGPAGAGALLALAEADMLEGDLDAALKQIAAARVLLGPERPDTAATHARIAFREGRIRYARVEFDEALAAFRRALASFRAAGKREDAMVAAVLNNEGLVLMEMGRNREAEVALEQAVGIYGRVLGPGHIDTAKGWYVLGSNDILQGEYARAVPRLETALAIERRVLDADNRSIADTLVQLGLARQGLKALPEAEEALRQALAIYGQAYNGQHYLIGTTSVYLATVLSDRGRNAEALGLLEEARRQYDASYGETHPNHGDLMVYRAEVLAREGRGGEARAECARGLAILSRLAGAEVTAPYRRRCAALQA